MSRHMRWLLAVVVGYAVFAAAYLPVYRHMYMAEASCDEPCNDFSGEEAARVAEAAGDRKIYTVKCEPLSLKLELLEPKVRASWQTPLWYRLTMKNASCRGIGPFQGEAFLDGIPSSRPAGFDVIRATSQYDGRFWDEFAGDGDVWNERDSAKVKGTPIADIIPYLGDPAAFKRMRRELGMDEYAWFDLLPGQQVQTATPILLPRRWRPGLDHGLYSGIPGMAKIARAALYPENPGYQAPPAGGYLYRFLLHPRKGRFRVVYQNGSLHAYPMPRFTHAQLQWASYPLLPVRAFEFLFEKKVMPTWEGRAFHFQVTAASNWVDFEATP